MRKRLWLLCIAVVIGTPSLGSAETVTFTAGDIKNIMLSYGTALHREDGYPYYGIKAAVFGIRVIPVVAGGYQITGESTDQLDWQALPDAEASTEYYTTSTAAMFHGTTYAIIDEPVGTFVDTQPPIIAVDDSASFSFDFTLDSGATWSGQWRFLVDGMLYDLNTDMGPIGLFVGGQDTSGIPQWDAELTGNTGLGFLASPNVAPIPSTLWAAMILLTICSLDRFRASRARRNIL